MSGARGREKREAARREAEGRPARLQPGETPPWEPEPVMEPEFWAKRLAEADGEIHRVLFNGSIAQFAPLEDEHRKILAEEIRPGDSVLDAGCGYGRILGLMPSGWHGDYVGVDVSPDLIKEAERRWPPFRFRNFGGKARVRRYDVGDLRNLPYADAAFDVAIVCSVKPMIVRNVGQEAWDHMEAEISRVTRRLLFLTYGQWD